MEKLKTLGKLVVNNWKTSSAGVITAGLALLVYYDVLTLEGAALWGGLATAIGLMVAKDGDAPKVDKPKL